jgi:NAD-dependent SIR2 family protein deacetylase
MFQRRQMATQQKVFQEAAKKIRNAQAILITAGYGIGVDSGLPDFRGNGFWTTFPPLKSRNLRFPQMANPVWFVDDPELAWGFYAYRMNLYRNTVPHQGFAILKQWIDSKPMGGFVFTSNVDGQFQKAGFSDNNIVETHGNIHHIQCRDPRSCPANPSVIT